MYRLSYEKAIGASDTTRVCVRHATAVRHFLSGAVRSSSDDMFEND